MASDVAKNGIYHGRLLVWLGAHLLLALRRTVDWIFIILLQSKWAVVVAAVEGTYDFFEQLLAHSVGSTMWTSCVGDLLQPTHLVCVARVFIPS